MNNLNKLMAADATFDDWLRQEMVDAGIDPDEADDTQRTGNGTFPGNYRIVCGNDIDKRCHRKDVAIRYAKLVARRLNARVYIYVASELYLTVYRGKIPRTETVYFDRKQEARYVRYV